MRVSPPGVRACDGHRAVRGKAGVFEEAERLVEVCLGEGIRGEETLGHLLHGEAQPCRSGAGSASLNLVNPAFRLDVEEALAEQIAW
jgi:hypothetical protein